MAHTPKITDEAVKKATGRAWNEWFKILDKAGAKKWPHKQTARWLWDQKLIKSGWWCQMVTVEYEKARGLRTLGKTADAGFEIGAQKTIDITPEAAWKLITSPSGVNVWLGKAKKLNFEPGETYKTAGGTGGEIRTVDEGTKIRLTYQPKDWPKPSTLQIYLLPTGRKTSVRFHHEKLSGSQEREAMRKHWQGVLNKLDRLAHEV